MGYCQDCQEVSWILFVFGFPTSTASAAPWTATQQLHQDSTPAAFLNYNSLKEQPAWQAQDQVHAGRGWEGLTWARDGLLAS